METECCNCSCMFKEKKKGYCRQGIGTKVKAVDKTLKEIIESHFHVTLTPEIRRKRFLCNKCTWAITSIGKADDSRKQFVRSSSGYLASKIRLRSPAATPRKIKRARLASTSSLGIQTEDSENKQRCFMKKKISTRVSEFRKAMRAFNQCHYEQGLKILLEYRSGFGKALKNLLQKIVRDEVSKLSRSTSKFKGKQDLCDIENFSWEDKFKELNHVCPFLCTMLIGSLTSINSSKVMGLASNSSRSITPTIGTIGSIILYQRAPRTFCAFQEINSIQLWLGGCKREVFPRFQHLGMSVGLTATTSIIDRLRSKFDKDVMKWKEDVADALLLPSESSDSRTISYVGGSDTPMSISSLSEDEARMSDDQTRTPNTTLPLQSELLHNSSHPCYSLCFDNVNQKMTVRHQTRDRSNKMLNMVQSYAARDRIPSLHLSDRMPTPDDIMDISLRAYLPTDIDETLLRSEMAVMIKKTLRDNLEVFKDLEIESHIHHPYQLESSRKSVIIPLGILDKDESKTSDMIEIMDCYQKYVPQKSDCMPLILLLHADGLSCERGNDAQSARINGSNAWTQLQGLKMSIQEWHKRQLLLQDAYDELYSGQSARDKGTLFHLKNFFNHRSVSSNVKNDFDHNEEFLDFCAQGYILLAAVHIMNIRDLDEKPMDMPSDENERQLYLDRVAYEIADSCFLSVVHVSNKAADVSNETEDTYDYCICKQEKPGQTMIYCDNKHCKKGTWFHLECLCMNEEDVPNGKWYCSPECKMPIHTYKQGKGKRKVVADALTDHKRDYALMVMWRGLNQRIRKDAIRENDGERMIRHWKFDMLQFFEKNHPKYFLQGQRLLSACNGAVSPRLKHTIIWNRTVNTRGGKGNNIAMDLHMEHLNNEYKASVKDSGTLTADTIARHSQMVGIGKAIRNVYELKLSDGHMRTHRKAVVDRSKDLKTFVEMMYFERIFENNPGRRHSAFQDFKFEILQNVNPKKLNARLVRLRKELSKRVKIIKQMQDC